jgi:hypothetical protein
MSRSHWLWSTCQGKCKLFKRASKNRIYYFIEPAGWAISTMIRGNKLRVHLVPVSQHLEMALKLES